MKTKTVVLTSVLALFLVACGGGASGGSTSGGSSSVGSLEIFAGQTTRFGNINIVPGGFDLPKGIATDVAGNVYVADTFNHTIRKITPAGVVSTLAGIADSVGSTDGISATARFNQPFGIATDSAGNVYVADTNNHTIRKISPAGTVSTLAGVAGISGSADGSSTAARFYFPNGIATDVAGNVYVADLNNHTIRKITPAGVVSTLAGRSFSRGSTDGIGAAARFDSPKGVAIDSAGNVYVADEGNGTIRKITSAGVVSTLAGAAGNFGLADGIGAAARFGSPTGVATDGAGNIYVADEGSSTIRKITSAGLVSTLAGRAGATGFADGNGAAARFSLPFGVATDAAGNVYVVDTFNYAIRKITPVGVVSTLTEATTHFGSADGSGTGARFNAPFGIAIRLG